MLKALNNISSRVLFIFVYIGTEKRGEAPFFGGWFGLLPTKEKCILSNVTLASV